MRKESFYNLHFAISGQAYVFNTLTSGLLALPAHVAGALQSGSLNLLDANTIDYLAQRKFVVSADVDELRCYEYYYNTRQYAIGEELFVVILPTYGCNLKCSYCYQGSGHGCGKMGHQEQCAIVRFVEKQLQEQKAYKRLKLIFFGGEPLVCKPFVIETADLIVDVARRMKVDVNISISTNGTLIDSDVIDRFLVPHSVRLQITVDGAAATHDKRRIDRQGNGTYDAIKRSLSMLETSGLRENVILRINVDRENDHEIESVLQEFSGMVGRFYIGRLRADGSNGCNGDACLTNESYLTELLPRLRELGKRYPIDKCGRQFGKMHPCGYNRKSTFLIDWKLDVYKCDGLVGRSEFAVGKVLPNGDFAPGDRYFQQSTWSPFHFAKCCGCKLLPICAGGCAYGNFLMSGNAEVPGCTINEKIVVDELARQMKSAEVR